MTAFSRQFVRLDGELVDAEFDPAGTINIQGHGLPAAFCSEEFHGVERARERTSERARRGGEEEREIEGREGEIELESVHFVWCDNVRIAQPTCRQWVGMNDLQALKRMNEQPERNVRLDNANTPVTPAIALSLANLWLQSDPMHPPRYVKLLLSAFLTPRSLTRDQFRVLIACHSPIYHTIHRRNSATRSFPWIFFYLRSKDKYFKLRRLYSIYTNQSTLISYVKYVLLILDSEDNIERKIWIEE